MTNNHYFIGPNTKAGSRSIMLQHEVVVNDGLCGFIEKPKDTRTCKNEWRAFLGIGEVTFLGHFSTKKAAGFAVYCAEIADKF